MATSTYMTFLMHKKDSTYEKLIDITEFPDLGTDPEMLETTTLSDRMQTFIMGIEGNEAMNFATNYDKAGYTALKALKNKRRERSPQDGHYDCPHFRHYGGRITRTQFQELEEISNGKADYLYLRW